jgi:hypothetical protein
MGITQHFVRTAVLLIAACVASIIGTAWAAHPAAVAQQPVVKWKSAPAPAGQVQSIECAASDMQARTMRDLRACLGVRMATQRTLATQGQAMRLERTMGPREFRSLICTPAADPAVE